uniref:C-type lectin domain-containing protein n=1 Tax=Gopherus agassizii TaxID=38772 RepID=A0A452HST7_9SAUR
MNAFSFQGSKFNPCPENWRRHGDYCYYFSTKWKTWQESKDYCLSLGSNLLKIKNKEELVISYPSVPRMKFSKNKCKLLHLGRKYQIHNYRMGNNW